MTDVLYNTEDAARRLDNQISPRTLEKWRLLGIGPKYRKLGRKVAYSESDLQEWVEGQRRNSTSE